MYTVKETRGELKHLLMKVVMQELRNIKDRKQEIGRCKSHLTNNYINYKQIKLSNWKPHGMPAYI